MFKHVKGKNEMTSFLPLDSKKGGNVTYVKDSSVMYGCTSLSVLYCLSCLGVWHHIYYIYLGLSMLIFGFPSLHMFRWYIEGIM